MNQSVGSVGGQPQPLHPPMTGLSPPLSFSFFFFTFYAITTAVAILNVCLGCAFAIRY